MTRCSQVVRRKSALAPNLLIQRRVPVGMVSAFQLGAGLSIEAFAVLPGSYGEVHGMKLITAIIKPYKVDDVREAIADLGVAGMTLTEAKGFGRQRGHTELYRGAEYVVDFLPKAKLEIAVDDALAERVVEVIVASARSGKIGDGKVFVTELVEAIRIRTGETGPSAI